MPCPRLSLTLLLLTLAVDRAAAQPTPEAPDSAARQSADLRVHGDTLWVTNFATDARGRRLGAAGPPMTAVLSASHSFMLVGARHVALTPALDRALRLLYREARECRDPRRGCELGAPLLQSLGAP